MADKLDLALVVRTVDQATGPLKKLQRTIRNVGQQTGLTNVTRGVGQVGRQMRLVGAEALVFTRRLACCGARRSRLFLRMEAREE